MLKSLFLILLSSSLFSIPSKIAPYAIEEIGYVYNQSQKHYQDPTIKKKETSLDSNLNRIYIGPMYEHFHLNATGIGLFNGNLWGAELGYEFKESWGLYATLNANCGYGSLYDTVNTSTISQIELLVKANIGYVIKWGRKQSHYFIPYLGYDYLWLRQYLEIVDYDPLRYTYKKPYLPFGLLFEMHALDCLSFSINYTYLVDIDSRLDVKQLIGSGWFLTKKNDYMLQFPIIFKIKDSFDIRLIPYYRRLRFGASTAVTSTGLALGLQPQGYQIWGGEIEISARF